MDTTDRQLELERIGAERLATEREVTRDAWRVMLWALVGCVGSCAIGMLLLGIAFWVNDRELGLVFFWSGLILGYSGMSYSLLSAYHRGEKSGYW